MKRDSDDEKACEGDYHEEGKDELNLAEFPLCSLAHRSRPGQKTLTFEDQLWDEGQRQHVTRRLTVTGSDAYGLPTPLDDEVLLGLIQLTKLARFISRTVPFTRYQLLRVLRWRDESKSYRRLEASLNRWTGVTLYYSNAWWDRARQRWVDEKFHVLDNVRLRRPGSVDRARGEGAASFFVWNDVIFRSFQSGYMKSLDFDFYLTLESAVAKRLYRFLDKRFWRRKRWEFDLKEFALEHTGLARTHDASDLKRHLRAAIAELERKGFLRPLPDEARFQKVSAGQWRVVFEAAQKGIQRAGEAPDRPTGIAGTLIQRGIDPAVAQKLAQDCAPERIQRQVKAFDYSLAKNDSRVSRNPPGFLIAAIRGDYALPREFLDSVAAQERQEERTARARMADAARQERSAREAQHQAEMRHALTQFWADATTDDRLRMEKLALAKATRLQRELLEEGGSAAIATRQALMDAFAEAQLMIHKHP